MPDRSVAIYTPSLECMKALTHGGGLIKPWMRQRATDNMIRNGRRPQFARLWIEAAINGGMTDAEFYEALIEKDATPKGAAAPELIDETPRDRWFRDAWRRSHNGGPIDIDLEVARRVHAKHILSAKDAVEGSEKARIDEILLGKSKVAAIDMRAVGVRINRARDIGELRQIWPRALQKPALYPIGLGA
jgi:hypothetical protein